MPRGLWSAVKAWLAAPPTGALIDGRDISVDGAKLDGVEALADVTANHPPQAHAASHVAGDAIQDATVAQPGLATAAQITKLTGIEPLADVTDATNVAAALAGTAFSSGAQLEYPTTGAIPDNTAVSGMVIKQGTVSGGGNLTLGDVYYLKTDGSWAQTDADVSASAENVLLGIALGTSPTTHGLLTRGIIDATGALGDHSPGKTVYLSGTLGKLTTVAPSGTGDVVRACGYCLVTAAEIVFEPSGDALLLT